jgi:alkane 1-monooxygenase
MNAAIEVPRTNVAVRRNWKYFLSLVPVVITIWGNLTGGPWAFSNFIFTFVIMAVLEQLVGDEKDNRVEDDATLPNTILVLHVIGQTLSVASLLYGITSGILVGGWIGAAILSTGTHSGTSSIVIAHELIHRKNALAQWASKYLMFTVSNPYFNVEHIRVHHKLVATVDDPATARKGENLYMFIARTIPMQIREVMRLEMARLRKEGANPYGLRNYVVGSLVLTVLVITGLSVSFDIRVGWAFLAQGLIATLLLEFTNYIEHYGLLRDKMIRVNETHSWQSDRIVSRYMLVDLSRHSDHHFHGAKPYHLLEHYSNSPELPFGYAGMFPLALIPPLYMKVMDKQLANYQAQQAAKLERSVQ